MKKLLLAAVLLAGTMGAYAQNEECYAPKAGSFSTEIQFNPFSGKDVFANGGVFSGAYFCSDNFAVVFDLGLSGTNSKYDVAYGDPDNKDLVTSYKTKYNGTFTLSLGAKYFFYNYKRVNLYCGGKVSYYHEFAGAKNVTNAKDDEWTWSNAGTGNGFGIHAFTGLNFSVYKGLYLGAELNVGFKDVIATGSTSKSRANGQETETKHKAGGHDFNGGFGVNPMFILGWNF